MYITRGESSPQGKVRVYFCAHPDDYEKYLGDVSGDILAFADCAVWYDKNPRGEFGTDLSENLSQMRLFVVPVTEKLLRTPNRAMDCEITFALENNIPVLPLMQEEGLIPAFTEKFGELQFLDRNIEDKTAIAYEDKLASFLNSVIVGDELAEKIRRAFDAYIFLSYRKKDRKYAQELMRLIHKNEFCRDIAIWYDEFLVPGENFNGAISDALEKSGLFALTVTPNLVNEKNYVADIEYPEAVKRKKQIIPFSMVETDKKLLKKTFEAIPKSAKTEKQLSRALLRAVRTLAIRANDSDPEHNFFIGLAYLLGIDVERDTEKAEKLITSAAENNLTEAMEKLADMYKYGNGVRRNFRKSAEWRERIAEQARSEYEKSGSEKCGYIYFQRLHDLGTAYLDMREEDKARKIYERADRLNRELAEKAKFYSHEISKHNTAVSYINLGGSEYRKNNFTGAEEKFREAEKIFRKLLTDAERESVIYGDEDMLQARRGLARVIRFIGQTKTAQKKFNDAEKLCAEALEISEKTAEKGSDAETRRDLSASLISLGSAKMTLGKFAAAEELFDRAVKIDRGLFEEERGTEEKRALAYSLRRLADALLRQREYARAEELYLEAFAIYEGCAEDGFISDVKASMFDIAKKTAEIAEETEEYQTAGSIYARTIAVFEKDEETDNNLDDLGVVYVKAATVESGKNDRGLLLKARKIFTELLEKNPRDERYTKYLEAIDYYISE